MSAIRGENRQPTIRRNPEHPCRSRRPRRSRSGPAWSGIEVQQHVKDVQAVARRAGHDLRADPRDLVVDGVESGRPRVWPKYFGEGPALRVRTGTTNAARRPEASPTYGARCPGHVHRTRPLPVDPSGNDANRFRRRRICGLAPQPCVITCLPTRSGRGSSSVSPRSSPSGRTQLGRRRLSLSSSRTCRD